MILEPRFTDSVADLPTHKFGPSSLTWWGIIGFMVIEGGFFALSFATYFFLMGHEQGWPPEGRVPPDMLAGTIFLIICLIRTYKGHFTPQQHFGFEAAAWYWHFVDVVWLFLFVCIYFWGAGEIAAH